MYDAAADNADRLTADAFHLAVSLEPLMTLDWAERIGAVTREASQQLTDLQKRRDLLALSRCGDAFIDWMLDAIDARLNFLQSLLNESSHGRNCTASTAVRH